MRSRTLAGPLGLVFARARHRPARWLWPALGLALAAAFACGVAGEGTIAGDRAARATLAQLSPLQRAVIVTQQGPATAATGREARSLLSRAGFPATTRSVLLNPVRLSGVLVRLAAIDPLGTWVRASRTGPCRPRRCPALIVGGTVTRRSLRTTGARITVAGRATLSSAAPLGLAPTHAGPPTLLTGDVAGLEAMPALSSVYRTESWLSVPTLTGLHSWQLAATARRLTAAQSSVPPAGGLSLATPLAALRAAAARAATAPRRLLPIAGGALAALAVFVILSAYGLRRDQRADRERLSVAGARTGQLLAFSLAEAAWLSAASLVAGAALGTIVIAVLAGRAGLPVGPVLAHSLLTPAGAAALAGGWLVAVAVVAAVLLLDGPAVGDGLGLAAGAALALALTVGTGSDATLALLAAPLACLAAGALIHRAAAQLLRTGERLARRGPLPLRLAFTALARRPEAPAVALAFVAISVGLAGFALCDRATLERGSSDQAAQAVGLDARIGPSANFTRPLQVATPAQWRRLAGPGARVFPVRRTDAALTLSGDSVEVTALGVPAAALPLIRDWRRNDGSAPLRTLSRRLTPRGAVRTPGPILPATGRIAIPIRAPNGELQLTADLRDRGGTVTRVGLGTATPRRRIATAQIPRRGGPYELEALELAEPSGEATLNAHQDGENAGAATQSTTEVLLGAATIDGRVRAWSDWTGVGAARTRAERTDGDPVLRIAFDDDGQPGIVRPRQPSDRRPVPVLADPVTAAGAGPGGQLPLTVDGEPVSARVVGIAHRFPTIAAQGPGFVIADEATLSGALDAALPGQGEPDELWITMRDPGRLRAALRLAPLRGFSASFRVGVRRSLRADPIARSVVGTLAWAAVITAALALAGLLVALLGAMRDRLTERDLAALGLGPRQLRRELALRVFLTGALGVVGGLLLAIGLTRLVVAAVRAAGSVAVPDPPLVAVQPWRQLVLLGIASIGACALLGVAGAAVTGRKRGE